MNDTQPKPTGEKGHTITEIHENIQKSLADARLTPEYAEEGREPEAYQPKPRKEDAALPTGEWTPVQEARIRIVNYFGDRVHFKRYEEDEIERIINAALAAEREKVKQIQSILDLSDRAKLGNEVLQLRDKVQTLVDALKQVRYVTAPIPQATQEQIAMQPIKAHKVAVDALARVGTYPLPDGRTK